MYKHILIATDGSELASHGVDHGLQLAKAVGAEVTIVSVTDLWASGTLSAAGPTTIAEYEQSMRESVRAILTEAGSKAENAGVKHQTKHIPNRYPADAIVEAAQDLAADLIVMTSHGRRGLRRMLLGSQTNEVLTMSTIPVLVVR